MKTVGLLGGTGWPSTIGYYKMLNELVSERLGGYHSAKILLKSIDYHDIMVNYGRNHEEIARILQQELKDFLVLKPDCVLICCNSLHKYYDMIKDSLQSQIPIFHAMHLVADYLIREKQEKALLLATKFTMEDGFFSRILEKRGISVTIPNQEERDIMQKIHGELMKNIITPDSQSYFESLIKKYQDSNAVILGCTEYSLVVDQSNSMLPIIDPVVLQVTCAIDYSLGA